MTHEELVEKVARNDYLEWLASFRRMPEYECDAIALRKYLRKKKSALAASPLSLKEERG